jgi:hypothetical protein
VTRRLVESPTMSDFQIADHGSIISIKPVSEAVRTWVDENVVSEPWQWLGGALCVDIRCARDLIDEIAAEGFEISL